MIKLKWFKTHKPSERYGICIFQLTSIDCLTYFDFFYITYLFQAVLRNSLDPKLKLDPCTFFWLRKNLQIRNTSLNKQKDLQRTEYRYFYQAEKTKTCHK